jgi:23S rRNA (uracil1939-C5)-methyltransferase
VRELLGRGPFNAGLDLYSGVGLIAMHMAASTKKILAVEEVGPAALEAMTAARRNRVSNILELCADSLEGVGTFSSEWGAPDWVVLNPPRGGCDEQVLDAVAAKAPRRLVYVSCGPKSLARDIKLLQAKQPGFKIRAIEPVDMFPQTEHTECLVLLENESYQKGLAGKAKGTKIRMKGARSKSRPLH